MSLVDIENDLKIVLSDNPLPEEGIIWTVNCMKPECGVRKYPLAAGFSFANTDLYPLLFQEGESRVVRACPKYHVKSHPRPTLRERLTQTTVVADDEILPTPTRIDVENRSNVAIDTAYFFPEGLTLRRCP